MNKEIITLGDNKTEKSKSQYFKYPINTKKAYVDEIKICNKIYSGKTVSITKIMKKCFQK